MTTTTPTLDRMLEIKDQADAISEFMEWLKYDKNIGTGRFTYHTVIHIDAHHQRALELSHDGEINTDEYFAAMFSLELRELHIHDMIDAGELNPECYGLDPDCPDAHDPRHKRPSQVVAENLDIEKLLYEFFDIDQRQLEKERDEFYRELQARN